MEPWSDETSAMSERPPAVKPNSCSRDCRFGCSTLSSLALPIFEAGSSCSRNMLKRVERPGMIKLVRKSSTLGRAKARSSSGLGGSCAFFPFFVFLGAAASSPPSLFFLVNQRFMMGRFHVSGALQNLSAGLSRGVQPRPHLILGVVTTGSRGRVHTQLRGEQGSEACFESARRRWRSNWGLTSGGVLALASKRFDVGGRSSRGEVHVACSGGGVWDSRNHNKMQSQDGA